MPPHGLFLGPCFKRRNPGEPRGQEGSRKPWGRFTIEVTFENRLAQALLDTGCGRTLVKKAKGPVTGERLTLHCIHADVKTYPTKIIKIHIKGHPYWCRAGVVPHLDTALVIGQDCPIWSQLVEEQRSYAKPPVQPTPTTRAQAEKIKASPLPVGPGEIAHPTAEDPTLTHARAAAAHERPPSQTGPYFTWKHSLLYWHDGQETHLVVP